MGVRVLDANPLDCHPLCRPREARRIVANELLAEVELALLLEGDERLQCQGGHGGSAVFPGVAQFHHDGPVRREQLPESRREVSALEQAEAISRKEALSELAVPGLPDGFTGTLARTIESLSSDAEARVRAHLEGHTVGADEHWVSQGLEFTKDDECPFCGRGLEGVALIASGGFLLLMDGFDEMSPGAGSDSRASDLARLAPLLLGGSPALLTSRPGYFVSDLEYATAKRKAALESDSLRLPEKAVRGRRLTSAMILYRKAQDRMRRRLSAYRDFLSEAYRQLKRDIAQLRSSITTISDDATVLRYSRVLDRNASSSEFWSQFVACTLPELSESETRVRWPVRSGQCSRGVCVADSLGPLARTCGSARCWTPSEAPLALLSSRQRRLPCLNSWQSASSQRSTITMGGRVRPSTRQNCIHSPSGLLQ